MLPEGERVVALPRQDDAYFTVTFRDTEGALVATFSRVRGVSPPVPDVGDIVVFGALAGNTRYEVVGREFEYTVYPGLSGSTRWYGVEVTVKKEVKAIPLTMDEMQRLLWGDEPDPPVLVPYIREHGVFAGAQ